MADEGRRAGRTITRIAVAFEAGHDGFWLARCLLARDVEAHVTHAARVERSHPTNGRSATPADLNRNGRNRIYVAWEELGTPS